MYADAALGDEGADHMMGIMKTQLHQVMDHVYCERVEDLSKHLVGQLSNPLTANDRDNNRFRKRRIEVEIVNN